jgi:glycosyltransferase involved in cell wall biosynthesis
MKGAADAVRVAVECIRGGLDVEMHCYGQGSERAEMDRLAALADANGRIHIHDAVTYPELVERSRSFDVFVCCHIQNDPSCTYIESFGAGLTVVGYANAMWRRLSEEAGVGFSSPMHDPSAVAETIRKISNNQGTLRAMSERARRFALEHCFEREFKHRTDDLNAILRNLQTRNEGPSRRAD